MDFKEIYEKGLINAQEQYVESSNFSSKPIMTTGIISPKSTISIQPMFGIEFELDQNGMEKIIEMFEDRWNAKSERERKNLLSVLTDIYSITEEYLGGHGMTSTRKNAYFQAKDNRLSLSEIEGKNIGLCAERAAIGHQLLSILQQAGLTNYESYLTNSHLTTNTREPHAFIVLKHKENASKQFIFDIENPLEYQRSDTDKPMLGIALYPITEEEYEAFKDGKSIAPQSIYEQIGMSIVGNKRLYGDEEYHQENEIII